MSLTYNAVVQKSRDAVNNTNEYINKINGIITILNDFGSEIVSVKNKVEENVIAADIINSVNDSVTKILKKIEEAINAANASISSAVTDCNSYITFLESDYNRNCEEDDKKIYLSRYSSTANNTVKTNVTTVNRKTDNAFSSLVGTTSSVATNTYTNSNNIVDTNNYDLENNMSSEVSSDSSINNYLPNFDINNIEEIDKYLDNILVNLETNNFDSDNITNWKDIIDKFLEEKHLNQQIDSITIQNNKVSCLTKMGISHILEDIKSVDDLVNKIRSVIV